MTAEWNRFIQCFKTYPEIGMSLDISRIRFSATFLEQMLPQAERAMQDMHALESGKVANPDENRMVGHYWLRAPQLAPTEAISQAISATVDEVTSFSRAVLSGKLTGSSNKPFRSAVLIGIGGSALGPQLLQDALTRATPPIKMYFFDNTDPDGFQRIFETLNLEETLFIVVSKSGSTKETKNGVLEAESRYRRAKLTFAKHLVAITCEGSQLDNQAKSEGWLKSFPMWDWVGGRTSIFSAVGLLPAALLGIDVQQFLNGAREMDQLTRTTEALNNPAMLLALMWYATGEGRGKKDMVVLPYKDRLLLFSRYLQQLVMESLGKEKDLSGEVVHQGIAVYGNKGSTDQHAYVQQLRDGVPNFFVTFIEVLHDYAELKSGIDLPPRLEVEAGVTSGDYLNGFYQGTRRALYENGRDSLTITLDRLSAESLAGLIALYERAVSFYASLVGINAYHQPGVEAGKKAASRVIEIQKKLVAFLAENKGDFAPVDLAKKISEDDPETVYKILEHLAENPGSGITRSGKRGPASVRYAFLK